MTLKHIGSVANLGEFHCREVPRGSVATEPGEGSGREGENRTLNSGFWGYFKLKIVSRPICYCFLQVKCIYSEFRPPKIHHLVRANLPNGNAIG